MSIETEATRKCNTMPVYVYERQEKLPCLLLRFFCVWKCEMKRHWDTRHTNLLTRKHLLSIFKFSRGRNCLNLDAVRKTHGVGWHTVVFSMRSEMGRETMDYIGKWYRVAVLAREANGWIYPELCMFSSPDNSLMR